MKPLLAMLALLVSPLLSAWQTTDCPNDPRYRISYPGGPVWPLTFFSNMPSGNWSHDQVETAMAQWNSIYGANDNLAISGGAFGYCRQVANAGIGVIGWDDGACYNWNSNELAITSFLIEGCTVTHASVYFNSNQSWDNEALRYAALHELGHYQIDDHDWSAVSIMGVTVHGQMRSPSTAWAQGSHWPHGEAEPGSGAPSRLALDGARAACPRERLLMGYSDGDSMTFFRCTST